MENYTLPDDTGLSCIYKVLKTNEIKSAIDRFLFELKNNNYDLSVEEDIEELHLTFAMVDNPLSFLDKQEILSRIESVSPDIARVRVTSAFILGEGSLVISADCPEITEAYSKFSSWMASKGYSVRHENFVPHITIGKVSRKNINIPDFIECPIYLKSLYFNI